MTDASDADLLEQFSHAGSEAAFTTLVQRHLALVYSVALRHTSHPEQAQDITQAVFIILAGKAGRLGRKTVLPGWLYHTARLTAANFQRAETRRIRREQEAFMQSTIENSPIDNAWRELAPQLDEAMACLGTVERDALVLRYFQNQSMAEVGRLLGLRENTAQKRLGRALEKLRKFFAKRGVASTTAVIASAISAHSVQAAPAGLVQTVSAGALAKGAAVSSSTITLVKGALKIMAWTKINTAVVVGVGILVAATTTTVTVKRIQEHRDDAWQLGQVSSTVLTRPPWRTEILPTRAAQRSKQDGNGGSVWMPDGRVLLINVPVEGIIYWAFNRAGLVYPVFTPARTVVETTLPAGNFDCISSQPKGAQEALQNEFQKKFGVKVGIQTFKTNVLFLEVKTPHSPGLKKPAQTQTMTTSTGNGKFILQNGSVSQLAIVVEELFGTPVIDRTGLTGSYDLTISWPSDTGQPDLDQFRQTLGRELGLDLVEGTAPVDLLVIERAN